MEFRINPSGFAVPLDPETHEPLEPRTLHFQEAAMLNGLIIPGATVVVGPFSDERWQTLVELIANPKATWEAQQVRSKIAVASQMPNGGPLPPHPQAK